MSTSKKTRSDSVLGTLTDDRKDAIADYARTHSLEDTVAWLRADGVPTSRTALSDWLSSYVLEQRFARSGTRAEKFRDWLATEAPDLSEEELDRRAALMFQFAAVEEGDSETWLAIATARQKARKDAATIRLQEQAGARDDRRIKLLESKAAQADEAKKTLGDGKLTEEQKAQRIRQIFGLS